LHCPFWQLTVPWLTEDGQAEPQEPQLAMSVSRFLHTPLHRVCPVGHAGIVVGIADAEVHWPFWQDCPYRQAWVQVPQCSGSASRL
jgi:hypothetical protein